jgi:ATP phosphoribosyltransferase
MKVQLQTIRARAEEISQFVERNAARIGVAGALVVAGSAHAADATETAITSTLTQLTGYGVAILGVAVAVWGIRKAIGMFGR